MRIPHKELIKFLKDHCVFPEDKHIVMMSNHRNSNQIQHILKNAVPRLEEKITIVSYPIYRGKSLQEEEIFNLLRKKYYPPSSKRQDVQKVEFTKKSKFMEDKHQSNVHSPKPVQTIMLGENNQPVYLREGLYDRQNTKIVIFDLDKIEKKILNRKDLQNLRIPHKELIKFLKEDCVFPEDKHIVMMSNHRNLNQIQHILKNAVPQLEEKITIVSYPIYRGKSLQEEEIFNLIRKKYYPSSAQHQNIQKVEFTKTKNLMDSIKIKKPTGEFLDRMVQVNSQLWNAQAQKTKNFMSSIKIKKTTGELLDRTMQVNSQFWSAQAQKTKNLMDSIKIKKPTEEFLDRVVQVNSQFWSAQAQKTKNFMRSIKIKKTTGEFLDKITQVNSQLWNAQVQKTEKVTINSNILPKGVICFDWNVFLKHNIQNNTTQSFSLYKDITQQALESIVSNPKEVESRIRNYQSIKRLIENAQNNSIQVAVIGNKSSTDSISTILQVAFPKLAKKIAIVSSPTQGSEVSTLSLIAEKCNVVNKKNIADKCKIMFVGQNINNVQYEDYKTISVSHTSASYLTEINNHINSIINNTNPTQITQGANQLLERENDHHLVPTKPASDNITASQVSRLQKQASPTVG